MLLQVMLPPITLWAAMELHSMFVLLAGVSLWLVSMYEVIQYACGNAAQLQFAHRSESILTGTCVVAAADQAFVREWPCSAALRLGTCLRSRL